MLDLALRRPPLGPNVLRKLEVLLGAFDETGLTPHEIGLSAQALQNYIAGAQKSAHDARAVEAESGISDAEWAEMLGPALERHVNQADYPTLSRMGEARRPRESTANAERFEFGLERILDGLEAYIRERSASNPPAA
jgi:hypothetical protein